METDDVLKEIGEFGRWQQWNWLLYSCAWIPCALQTILPTFSAAMPELQCSLPSGSCAPLNSTTLCGLQNSNWTYQHTDPYRTIVAEWDLTCEHQWKASLVTSIYFAGFAAGSTLFGVVGDILGRRRTFLAVHCVCLIFGALSATANSYEIYCVFRMLTGAGVAGLGLLSFIVPAEVIGVNGDRGFWLTSQSAVFGLGCALVAPVAYLFPGWRMFSVVITLPHLCYLTCCIPCAVESPRWLLTKGNGPAALAIFRRIADTNGRSAFLPGLDQIQVGVSISSTSHFGDELDGPKQKGMSDLFATQPMRGWTIVMMLTWLVNSFVFYGIGLNTGNLAADRYVGVFLGGAVQVVSVPIFAVVLDKFGRRKSISGATVGSGVCMCICGMISLPQDCLLSGSDCDEKRIRLWISMLAMCLMSGSFAGLFTYGGEIFPTEVRSSGMGLSSFAARIGGICAPLCLLLSAWSENLPFFVFGISGIVIGTTVLTLPETLNVQLPDTLADVSQLHSKSSSQRGIEMSEFSHLDDGGDF